jgi:hypothetical protein
MNNNSLTKIHKTRQNRTKIFVSLHQNRGVAIIRPDSYTNGIRPQLTKFMEKNIHNVARPDDALAQFVGEQYIEWLVEYFDHEVASWEALELIAQAQPKPDKIKKFLGQRYILDQIFFGGRDSDPGFLGFAVANLSESPEPLAEHVLDIINSRRQLDNASVVSHRKESWLRLLRAVGLTDDDIRRLEPKEAARNYASELSDLYSNAEWQSVLAAFFAHEKLVQAEYEAVSNMLNSNVGQSAFDTEALSGKVRQDNKYLIDARHMLERSAVDDESKSLIFHGLERQLVARKDFYNATVKYLYE